MVVSLCVTAAFGEEVLPEIKSVKDVVRAKIKDAGVSKSDVGVNSQGRPYEIYATIKFFNKCVVPDQVVKKTTLSFDDQDRLSVLKISLFKFNKKIKICPQVARPIEKTYLVGEFNSTQKGLRNITVKVEKVQAELVED